MQNNENISNILEMMIEMMPNDKQLTEINAIRKEQKLPSHENPVLLQNISRIMRHPLPLEFMEENKCRIYSLFYVDPLDAKTGVWDLLIILAIYLFQIQISLTLGFGPDFWDQQLTNNFYASTYLFMILILMIDIVINFHKGYYAFGRGKVITQPQLIIKHYLKIYFTIDLISTINHNTVLSTLLIPLFLSNYFLNFLQLLPAILLYFKKFKYQNQIITMLQYRRKLRVFFILTMLGFDLLLIGHFGACIFVGLDLFLWRLQYYGNQPRHYWLSHNTMYSVDLLNGPWIIQYIYAQSFSTGTLSTIAPGPFGMNPVEIAYANFVMIFFMLLASYAVEVLVSILLEEDQIRTFHEDNIQKFDRFMKLKGVKSAISDKIHNFFQLVWETEVKMNIDLEKEVLDKLPISIRDELLIEMEFIKTLKLVHNFSNSSLLIHVLSLKVSKIVLDSDRILFNKGQFPTLLEPRYLYYFKEGIAKLYLPSPNGKTFLLSLSNFERVVGQFQFITGLAYNYTCQSVELCMVTRLSQIDFMEALKSSNMAEQFYEIKYKLMIENQVNTISKMCLICQASHVESRCYEISQSMRVKNNLIFIHKRGNDSRIPYTRLSINKKKIKKINQQIIKGYSIPLLQTLQSTSLLINPAPIDTIEYVASYENFFPNHNAYKNTLSLTL